MDVPGISRPVLVALIVVAVLLFAYGGTKAAGLLTQHTDTHTRTLAAAPTIVVHVNGGDVRAEDLGGGVDLSSATGDLHVEGVRGPVRVSTATGDVHVEADG